MTFKDITIEQLQKLHNAIKIHGDNAYELGMDILEIFESEERSKLKLMTIAEFDKRFEKYKFLTEGKLNNDAWVKEFEFDGVKYKVNQTPETWNVGQFVSMSALTKGSEDEIVNSMHVILAVMCCKNDEEVVPTSEKFKGLTVDIAYPIALFFSSVMCLLPPDILHYFKAIHLQTGSVQSGDGTTY